MNVYLHLRFIKKELKIDTVLITEYPPETVDALGFEPIGLDEPYRIIVQNNPVNYVDPYGLAIAVNKPPRLSFPDWVPSGLADALNDMMSDPTLIGPMTIEGGGSCPLRPASEKTATDIGKQIERDINKEARRMFHDMKEGGDRTLQELKDDAAYIYEQAGKTLPKWLR